MRKQVIILLIFLGLVLITWYGTTRISPIVKEKVAKKLSEEFNISHSGIDVGVLTRTIKIDSISGIGNNSKLSSLKLVDLNWYKLYMKQNIEFNDLCFDIENFKTKTKDGLHQINISKVSKRGDELTLEGLKLHSPLGLGDFFETVKSRSSRMTINAPSIEITGLSNEPFSAQLVKINNIDILVEEDLNLPVGERKKKLIAQVLHDIESPFIFDSLQISHANITYKAKDKGSSKWSKLDFRNSVIAGENITNDSTAIAYNNEMVIELNSKLEGSGKLLFITKHFLDSPTYRYDAYGKVESFPLSHISQAVEDARNITIEKGFVYTFEMNGSFSDRMGSGEMHLSYDDLRIDLNRKMLGIADLVGNMLIKSKAEEDTTFEVPRNINKGFLVHVVDCLKVGLKDIIPIIDLTSIKLEL